MFFINFIKRIFLLCQQNPKKFNKFIKKKKKKKIFLKKKKSKKFWHFLDIPKKCQKKNLIFGNFKKSKNFRRKTPF